MSDTFKRVANVTAIGGSAALAVCYVLYASGARINTTESIPVGLYWTAKQPIEKGSYVMFCPPRRALFDEAMERGYIGAGFCDGGYGYMMKRVLAAKGDSVTSNTHGVFVNGVQVPHSVPLVADDAGRPLPRFGVAERRLSKNELLLMSDVCDASFDGRYFGPVERTQIKWVVRPVLTW
ncbi:conjugative transfer signal peptidase TraF [Burkholderia aenigmatica]|uniref:conjugative transfer signal peptidase TraF n=1 Tax=Burkholderia aenigmatica TaxID=2015348 RepID=UPI00264D76B6|nr:conjugative transfer signal peptidase TraF [Burkholderia aenigmatica]MDN7880064.1 conjugative transfer signal peptidase TraF [Burkholderia aenigmatica]